MSAPEGRIVLIAGEGALPVEIARCLHERGTPPVVVTLRGDDGALAPWSEAVVHLRFPSLGRVVREARRHGAERLIMAGHIAKRTIYLLPALAAGLSLGHALARFIPTSLLRRLIFLVLYAACLYTIWSVVSKG